NPTTINTPPDLSISKSHTGNFTAGQTNATYSIVVTNSGGTATSGTMTVTDTLPAGLTATAMSGTNWSCATLPATGPATLTCTRSTSLAAGSSSTITLTVTVANNAPASVTNSVTVSGGGEVNTANNSDSDPTTINHPDLTISKTHTGNFTRGQTGAIYTITVTNSGAAAIPSGTTITV